MTTTERIPVLVTSQEKERIAKLASDAGLSMGEFLRQAAESFRPEEETEMLLGMIDQMLKTTARTSDAIDDALEFIEASNKRMEALEANREQR
ncbi:MAG: ribbon-helix-helix protein, CopG family [Pseudomonadota bacterium]